MIAREMPPRALHRQFPAPPIVISGWHDVHRVKRAPALWRFPNDPVDTCLTAHHKRPSPLQVSGRRVRFRAQKALASSRSWTGECPERQRGRTVNPLADAFVGSSPTSPTTHSRETAPLPVGQRTCHISGTCGNPGRNTRLQATANCLDQPEFRGPCLSFPKLIFRAVWTDCDRDRFAFDGDLIRKTRHAIERQCRRPG
jgi:hypothetical protein